MAKLILPTSDNDRPSVSDLLEKAFPEDDTGGPSGFGWHATATYMQCQRKAYYQIAQGLRKKSYRGTSDALNFGTLMHAVLALHYRDPERGQEPIEAIREVYPELAEEATLTYRKLKAKYNKAERETWDPRATEFEARYDFEGKPTFSDSLVVPAFFTCRYDLVVGLKSADEERKPLGERCDLIRCVDHKFHARLFYDLIPGYKWDGQFIAQTLIWEQSGMEKILGKLDGITISIFVRERKQQDPMQRFNIRFDGETVGNFRKTVEPMILDCHAKLLHHRNDIEMWPQNFTACSTKYGLCPFFDLCESNGRTAFMYEKKSTLSDALADSKSKDDKDKK